MRNLDLLLEVASLAGYTINATTGQDVTNKARALRRLMTVKADIVGKYNDWPANYREGYLVLTALYNTGTITLTNASQTVTGSGTTFTSEMKGRKLIAPNGESYRISSYVSTTSLILDKPYQGATAAGASYSIWQDEYSLYPDVRVVGGFIDFSLSQTMTEALNNRMKESYSNPSYVDRTDVYSVIGRETLSTSYSTGTVSGTINTGVITGSGTSWLANVQPGFEILIGTVRYHVKNVNSDTEIELYQLLASTVAALSTYAAVGKNAAKVRFNAPSSAKLVSYWYNAKDYPFVNDSDEDWIAEMYPNVLMKGITIYDYIDKNDPVRADRATIAFKMAVEEMHTAQLNSFMGVRTLPLYVPPEAYE